MLRLLQIPFSFGNCVVGATNVVSTTQVLVGSASLSTSGRILDGWSTAACTCTAIRIVPVASGVCELVDVVFLKDGNEIIDGDAVVQ